MSLSPDDLHAIRLSLQVSAMALAIFLIPGIALGIWLGTGASRSRTIVNTLLSIPLVLPPVVAGLLLLKFLIAARIPLVFTWWAAAIASALVAGPLLVRTVAASAEQIDRKLLMVASTLGAGRLRIARTIIAPLCWRGILAGTVLFWARALGEFGAVMVVAGNTPGRTQTIPLAIYSKLESARDESIWPLVGISIAISALAVIGSELLGRRRRTA